MSALVQRALREPVRFDRDIPGPDRRALEVLVAAGVLKKERQGKVTVFAPVVTLAEFRKPKAAKPRENVETWLRKSLAARAKIPGADAWKKTAFAQGRFRMMIDGAPCYFAAHVKTWKAGNKAALCQGSDPWGLELSRPESRWISPPQDHNLFAHAGGSVTMPCGRHDVGRYRRRALAYQEYSRAL